jgi:pilus assembly protein Flp/PilA
MLRLQLVIVRLVKDLTAQDMVEYALLAGFIAVAAGALLPGISDSISTIFSRMASVVSAAAGGGGGNLSTAVPTT